MDLDLARLLTPRKKSLCVLSPIKAPFETHENSLCCACLARKGPFRSLSTKPPPVSGQLACLSRCPLSAINRFVAPGERRVGGVLSFCEGFWRGNWLVPGGEDKASPVNMVRLTSSQGVEGDSEEDEACCESRCVRSGMRPDSPTRWLRRTYRARHGFPWGNHDMFTWLSAARSCR